MIAEQWQGFYGRVQRHGPSVQKHYWPTPHAPRLCVEEQRSWHWLQDGYCRLGLTRLNPIMLSPLSWQADYIVGQPQAWRPELYQPWSDFLNRWSQLPRRRARLSLRRQALARWPRAQLGLSALSWPLRHHLTQSAQQLLPTLSDQLGWDGVTHGDLHSGNVLWHQGRIVSVVDPWFAGYRHPSWELALLPAPQDNCWFEAVEGLSTEPFATLWLLRLLVDLEHLSYLPHWSAEDYFQSLLTLRSMANWQAWRML